MSINDRGARCTEEIIKLPSDRSHELRMGGSEVASGDLKCPMILRESTSGLPLRREFLFAFFFHGE